MPSRSERREARQERREERRAERAASRAAAAAPSTPSWQSAMDQRAASGQTVGDQWFNSVGGSATDRNAAIQYASNKGYSMGQAWGAQASPFGRPASVQDSYVDAGTEQSYGTRFIPGTGRDGLGVWAAGPMSDAQIRGLYGSQAPGAAQANAAAPGSAAPASAAPQEKASKKSKIKDTKSVRQGLLIAGLNGNISKRELEQIGEATGKDSNRIIKQLDKLNTSKDLTIGLGNAAVKGLMKSPFPSLGYGEGKIGSALGDYWRATNAPTQTSDPFSGSTNLWQGYDEVTPGMKQSRAGLVPLQGGAYQLDAKGKYSPKTSNKLFMSNYMDKVSGAATDPATAATAPTAATEAPTGEVMDNTGAFDMPPPEEPSGGGGGALGGGEGYGGASYLKAARSRWKKLGISTQGANALSRGLNYSNMFGR